MSTSEFEQEYVVKVYDKIASSFNTSRQGYHWKRIKNFINSLPSGSSVLDAGCGNGKNMRIRPDLKFTGCDTSEALLDICRNEGHDVVNANIKCLPFENEKFDVVICIAVLHHIDNNRSSVLKELFRVMKPGGLLFVQVWAREQELTKRFVEQETHNDFFVSWTDVDGRVFQRYYHLFPEKEIDELVKDTGSLCLEKGFECNNWYFILKNVCV